MRELRTAISKVREGPGFWPRGGSSSSSGPTGSPFLAHPRGAVTRAILVLLLCLAPVCLVPVEASALASGARIPLEDLIGKCPAIESFTSGNGEVEFSEFEAHIDRFSARNFEVEVLEDGFSLVPEGEFGARGNSSINLMLDFWIEGIDDDIDAISMMMRPVFDEPLVSKRGTVAVEFTGGTCANWRCDPLVELDLFESSSESKRADASRLSEPAGRLNSWVDITLNSKSHGERHGHGWWRDQNWDWGRGHDHHHAGHHRWHRDDDGWWWKGGWDWKPKNKKGFAEFPIVDIKVSIVPEPGTGSLLLIGLGALAALRRHQTDGTDSD